MALEKSGNFFSDFVTTLCVEYVKWVISMCCLCVGLMTVLTHCEVNSVPAVLYICYTRSPLSASVTAITAFRQLCESASLADIIVVSNRQVSLYLYLSLFLPSVLWRCWLGSRKGIRPVKNWVVGYWRGYLSGARCNLHMAQLMPLPLTVSCFSKIQIGFTFLVPAHPGSPVKMAVKRVCVRAAK